MCTPTASVADAPDPTPLRWGLNDVLWGDDDTVTILLSGPTGEPYWLELDADRAAALRQDLAGPVPSVDRAALRERITTAISKWHRDPEQPLYEQGADAVLAVLPAPADRAAARPTTLHAIARHLEARAVAILRSNSETYAEYHAVAALLRRKVAAPGAAAAPETETPAVSCSFASLRRPHPAHDWEPQPGMTPVHCPGTTPETEA